jgi:hypothetical protein
MKTAIVIATIFGLAACETPPPQQTRRESETKSDEQMRQAGRTAYDAAQKAEEAARELSRQVERAGKEAREGWEEAKRDHERQKK